jgi:diguanylate cyclase (GGDEF)-like protein/PAS domain S-box-containing protein
MTALAAIVALAALITVAALAVAAREHDKARQARDQRGAQAASAINRAAQQTIRGLEGLHTLAIATGAPEPTAYRRLAATLLDQPEVAAFSWVTRVPASGRAALERRTHKSIVDARTSASNVPEPPRAEYFPVALIASRTPTATSSLPDVAADPLRVAAIRTAAVSGRPAATAPVVLLRGRPGIVIYHPTYGPGAPTATAAQRIRALTGLTAGVYDTRNLLAAISAQLPAGTRLAVSDADAQLTIRAPSPPNAVTRTVTVAGRHWNVTVGGPSAGTSSLPLVIGLGGAALTLVLGLLFVLGGRRERYALAKVRERMIERDSAEAALREAEARFRGAFEGAPIGIAIVDLDGRFTEVNAAFSRLTGYPTDQLLGMNFGVITHPDDRVVSDERFQQLLRRGRTVSFDKRYLHAAGHTIWVSVHSRLVCDDDGRPLHTITMIEDVTDRRQFEHKLRYMADHDPLTGLLNRRRFEEEVDRQVAHSKRYGGGGAVLMLDLDHFKYTNDSLGHRAGDELIVAVAKVLRGALRETDTLARLGGDEFAVLLPRATEEESRVVGQKLLEGLRGEAVAFGLRRRRLTASMGIALIETSGDDLTADDLLVSADLALYDAKEVGRDGLRVFADEEQREARMRARVSWVERIQSALENDAFVLYAQPIVDLRTHLVTRHELLLRMRAEDGDLIPPGAFLFVAERYGLINEIDRWVVRRAIGLIRTAHEAGRELRLEVNISGLSLGDEELLGLIERELADGEINPGNLIFEVTETAAVSNIVAAREFAERVCALGCRFALDDFGAGYGSFYYLKHLPFDFVKIDGEFVRNCVDSKTDQLVVQAVVQIARGLGKQTIAEFVEDEATIEVLERFGVDYAQGYHVGRPAPLSDDLVEAQAHA